MEYYNFKAFTRVLLQFMMALTSVFGVQRVNQGDTPASGWIHLKIQCVLLLVGLMSWISVTQFGHACTTL